MYFPLVRNVKVCLTYVYPDTSKQHITHSLYLYFSFLQTSKQTKIKQRQFESKETNKKREHVVFTRLRIERDTKATDRDYSHTDALVCPLAIEGLLHNQSLKAFTLPRMRNVYKMLSHWLTYTFSRRNI